MPFEASDSGNKYIAQPWSCRDFDEKKCAEELLESLGEHYNTVYSCCFLPSSSVPSNDGWLLATLHSGDIRLFNWSRLCSNWLTTRAQGTCHYKWKGHEGPAYALALLTAGNLPLLATAGDDGFVRLWRLADIWQVAAVAASPLEQSHQQQHQQQGPAALAALQLPHVHNALGLSNGSQPAGQSLVIDQQHQQLFVGGSDGGVHVVDLQQLLAATRQGVSPATAAAVALTSLPGHLAAVLDLDYCPARRQLVSASEDGTIRVWDVTSKATCIAVINPAEGEGLPINQALELLRCIKSPAVTCVRYDTSGSWLVCGDADNGLTLWNCGLNQVAVRKTLGKCTPQVLLLAPNSVFVGGTDRKVHHYSFSLELQNSFDVGADSVFGLVTDVASDMLAVCGCKGCLDFVTMSGQSKGAVRPPLSVFMKEF